jgi:serine/threonine-protein kinase
MLLMQGTTIHLSKPWRLGERIGEGGFGEVYAAMTDDIRAAVKVVPKAPGAQRELLFVHLDGVRNVVPVIDHGETEKAWVIVMPRADKSLRKQITDEGGGLGTGQAVTVLTDIAAALSDLAAQVVHRDLKPENVLLLDGHWCLADFGISRYAEATTAADTKKFSMTAQYAAPEQWRSERASSATDVYAFGIIAFELLTGTRPFVGPDSHDYREQHLHETPPQLLGVPATLAALVEECLYKSAGARPSATDLERRLAGVLVPSAVPGLAKLQQAHHRQVGLRADQDRRQLVAATSSERRTRLHVAALQNFAGIATALREAITEAAPSAESGRPGLRRLDGKWELQLGPATMSLAAPTAMTNEPWGGQGRPAFDVITHAALSLSVPANHYGYEGRSHSLWYCDPFEEDRFGWYEVAFMHSPLLQRTSSMAPFALPPGPDAARTLLPGMDVMQLAWPFTRLTIGDLDEFIGRWAEWLAVASVGELNQPSSMPEITITRNWRT